MAPVLYYGTQWGWGPPLSQIQYFVYYDTLNFGRPRNRHHTKHMADHGAPCPRSRTQPIISHWHPHYR